MFDWLRRKILMIAHGWVHENRYKFFSLTKYRQIYASYSWEDGKLYLTLSDPTEKNAVNIIELKLNPDQSVRYLINKGETLYTQDQDET